MTIRLRPFTAARAVSLVLAGMAALALAGCSDDKPAEKSKTETVHKAPETRAQAPLGKGFRFLRALAVLVADLVRRQ